MNARERIAGAHTRTARQSGWSALTEWRNWSLPVKLGAVMLVPTVLAIVLGVVVIRGQVATAAGYTGSDQRTTLAERVRVTAEALQLERVFEANSQVPGNPVTDRLQREQEGKVDAAVASARKAFATTGALDQAGESAWAEADRQLDRLDSVRATAQSPALVPSTVTGYYTDIITSMIDLERALLSKVGDSEVAGLATATYDLDAAREEVSLQQATVLVGLARGDLLPDETELLRSSSIRYDEVLDDFRSVGGSELAERFDRTVTGPDVDRRPTLLRDVLISQGGATPTGSAESAASPGASLGVAVGPWNKTSRTATGKLTQMADSVSTDLRARASSLQEGASNRAGVTAVILFVTLLAAAAVVIVMARQLLRSMRTLHRTAQSVAEHELPEAVADIRSGRTVSTEIASVPVRTEEEIGQLARAFDAVHSEARRLAVEQASMRTSYGNVFINLSRRSQSLVQRQLRLIEQLERDEEDPDQLSTLFQLDHLATRMRRNNENLMVLSGSEPGRGSGQQPTALADLLRAGVSEIEHYQRVEVQPPPGVHIVGYASGDLVRLVAELLDNATAFSAPETQVTVSTHLASGGSVVIDIVDRGIGMVALDLQQANEVLATAGTDEVPASRRMGLFVVNRLAERHSISVRLFGGDDIEGIRACITIPTGLIAAIDEPAEHLEAPEPQQPAREPSPQERVGPTLPAAAEPFGERQQADTPAGGHPGQEQQRELPRRHAPEVPAQEREQTSARLSGANGFGPPPAASTPAEGLFTPAPAPKAEEARQAGPEQRDGSENTPIFDEMISAWFVPHATVPSSEGRQGAANGSRHAGPDTNGTASNGTASNGTAANGARSNGAAAEEFDIWSVSERNSADRPERSTEDDWRFAADEGWQAASAVSDSQPEDFTSVGLPKRTPRARLVPGSAGSDAGSDAGNDEEQDPVAPAPRDADNVRNRLSSFQRGIAGGRADSDESHGRRQAGGDRHGTANGGGTFGITGTDDGGGQEMYFSTVGGADRSDVDGRAGGDVAEREPSEPDDPGRWRFAADEGWRAVEAVSNSTPEDVTEAGLPRRNPRARLVPGSAGGTEAGPATSRDPDNVRSRLGSFQRGLEDGRHSVRGPAHDTLEYGNTQEKE